MQTIKRLFISFFILIFALWGCKNKDPQPYSDEQKVSEDSAIIIQDPIFEKALAAYDSDKTINGQVLYDDIYV